MLAWLFRGKEPRTLIHWGIGLIVLQLLSMGAIAAQLQMLSAALAVANPNPELVEQWAEITREIGVPSAAALRADMALYLGPWSGIALHQLTEDAATPLIGTLIFGCETLAYMLFGMAALKTGFLTGGWDNARYRRVALIGFGISVPAYLVLAALTYADGFSVPGLFTYGFAGSVPFRPLMVVGYAALIILLTRRGGWLVDRIAAAGRAAFTNYLGTSIILNGPVLWLGIGWVWKPQPNRIVAGRVRHVGPYVGLVEAVARPLRLRPAGMAVAQPGALGDPADAPPNSRQRPCRGGLMMDHAAQPKTERLITLDVIRGISVMGIFSVNVVGMAMLQFAYFYPPAFGFESLGDRLMWLGNFLFVDGKFRSLFSILFGASLMLVVEGAACADRSPWRTHYARMIVLLLLGWLHFALLWWGDILTHYAAVGMVAFLMWKLRAKTLLIISLVLFVAHAAPAFTSSPLRQPTTSCLGSPTRRPKSKRNGPSG